MTENKIKKANDILDKFEFFNQRAGRELWSDKPKDIQDKDIENFSNYVKFLKDFINRQKAEIERLNKEVDRLSQIVLYHDGHIADAKAEATKEFAERIDTHFKGSGIHWLYEVILKQRIDNLVKEMVGDVE